MTTAIRQTERGSLPRASVVDTLRITSGVVIPIVAQGPIIRRPKVMALAERLDLNKRAVKSIQRLRDEYGPGPVLLRNPIRPQAIVLDPEHVHRILDNSPEPFATATDEKRAALSHFEPKGALISHGRKRVERRRLNEDVLDAGQVMHRLAGQFTPVVREEAARIRSRAGQDGALTWDSFSEGWFRMVRRVVFGDGAADDEELRDIVDQLRSDANWAFMRRKRKELRREFFRKLNAHLARAEAGSLAGLIAATEHGPHAAPDHQVPQWLFAFDPAGMATLRALALLATHPKQEGRARTEIEGQAGATPPDLPYLRSCVLEALRLWPTTPMVLRQTTAPTEWDTGDMPKKTGILIFAPFFHRDDAHLTYAHTFTPEIWLERRTNSDWPLIPFSGGPAMCPARNLVTFLASAMLAELLDDTSWTLTRPRSLTPDKQLPGTLNHYGLRFALSGRAG
jgi:cytochrome P450